jgi:hypothetical protein
MKAPVPTVGEHLTSGSIGSRVLNPCLAAQFVRQFFVSVICSFPQWNPFSPFDGSPTLKPSQRALPGPGFGRNVNQSIRAAV